ncbi:DUF87 domain-containing protein [Endozoicomonas sp. G2_2]|uniref:ATP-binding protein n=1 Tax=Endozoicomonas sp. G2_2 TaxID=2821092 RepID=UPI001ADCB828|nr:DUF87 domain-containing protein [Endozoicomonas sp. G2_2]MBO9471099.1 DUF87 domain-containing protein [Endozoicomonas sp. G2_2]
MANPASVSELNPLSAHTPIRLGTSFSGAAFELPLAKAMNFNLGLVGASGSGKTTALSFLIEEYVKRGITVIALDTQGDQAGGTSGIEEAYVERMVFRYGDTQAQINPLQLHSNADAGGPYSAIEDAIEVVRLLKPSLGDMQVADLRWLLCGFLERCGVDMLEKSTWDNERIGPWSAFRDYIREQLAALRAGVTSPFFKDFRRASKLARKIQSGREMKVPSDWQHMLEARPGSALELSDLEEIVRHRASGMFQDAIDGYSDMDTERNPRRIAILESIITNMIDSTLFDDDRLKIKPGRVNIIDLSNVSQRHMMSLIHLMLKRTFSIAQRFTRNLNPPVPWLMLALDESKLAVQTGKDVLAPINRIATEGRKYGMGLLLGVQHLGHLNGEIMSSLATKLILPIDRDKLAETCRRLMIKAGELEQIKPRSDGLIFLNKDAGVPVHLMRGA